uniref:Uncharacterized protein n=1 Tax=Steinernema glaseri TaxID=37863 RepID=A0A1I7ZPW1_9BILA
MAASASSASTVTQKANTSAFEVTGSESDIREPPRETQLDTTGYLSGRYGRWKGGRRQASLNWILDERRREHGKEQDEQLAAEAAEDTTKRPAKLGTDHYIALIVMCLRRFYGPLSYRIRSVGNYPRLQELLVQKRDPLRVLFLLITMKRTVNTWACGWEQESQIRFMVSRQVSLVRAAKSGSHTSGLVYMAAVAMAPSVTRQVIGTPQQSGLEEFLIALESKSTSKLHNIAFIIMDVNNVCKRSWKMVAI